MATLSRVKTWNDGDTLTASDLNAEFNNIMNDYNGNITNANINASAAIAYSKLNLSGSIVNADISASAAIAASKLDATLLTTTGTQTLTNKRITKRVGSVVSDATPTINTDSYDMYIITAQAAAITSFTTNLTGTPTNGQTFVVRIKDDGTARAITWGASFASRGVTLPTTTVAGKYLYVGFMWNEQVSVWDCIASVQEQ